MKKILRLVIALFFTAGFATAFAQFPGCPAVSTQSNVNMPCGTSCVTLNATAFSGAQTTAYTVGAITYAPPFAFNTGTPVLVHTDDLWSSSISLPFNFCFFGNTYSNIIVGSNGAVSFNTANAGAFNSWNIPGAIPRAAPADMRNTIMGPWQDMDPTNQGAIYYEIGGTAPCRYFKVAWYRCPMFGDPNSVDATLCDSAFHQTSEIVLYETTNAIDIYIQEKSYCTQWNGGLAIEGIQNAAGTVAYTVPGRNATQWLAANDAYRFTPAGAPNFTIAWFKGASQIASTDTVTVCPSAATVYTVQATYTNCDASVVVVSDSVHVTPGGSLAIAIDSVRQVSCNNGSNGYVHATVTSGVGLASFGWSPGGAGQTSLSNIPAGTYVFSATDSSGCTGSDTVVLGNPSAITANVSADTIISCSGSTNSGTLTVTASGGTPGYTYLWSSGQTTATISGLGAGTYTVTITDANGCTATASGTVLVIGNPVILGVPTINNATCSGASNGSITANASGGTGSITYSWNTGATTQTISGLGTGTYCVTATDQGGCSASACYNIVQSGSVIIDSGTVSPVQCGGVLGTITVTVSGGTAPYIFTWSSGGTGNPLSNLNGGSYTVTVTDANGCSASAFYIVGTSSCGGCPAVNTNNNVSIPCSQTCTTLSATAFSAAQTTSYTVGSIPYAPGFAYNSGTPILVHIDDRWSSVINLPFTFCFYGVPYTSIIVGSNGAVSFNVTNAGTFNSWQIPGTIPRAAPADMQNTIMGPWQDMDPTNQGAIYWNVTGVAPCRKFEVAWYRCPMYGDPNSVSPFLCDSAFHQTQMIVIYETTNAIDINIQEKSYCTQWNGGLAIEGIQGTGNPPPALAVPGRNATQWVASSDAYRFTPAGAPNFVIDWYHGNTLLGTGDTLTVCPDSSTIYTVQATYTNCDNSVVTVSDSVFVTPGGGLTVTIDSTINPTCGQNNGAVYASYSTTGSPVTSFGWSPGGANVTSLTNLGPGTYIFTVTTAGGRTKSDTVTLTAAPGVTVTVANDTVSSCSGGTNSGSLTAVATSGTPGYTYLWNSGQSTATITGLTAGTYTVTVTDAAGCTATASGTVVVIGGGGLTFGIPTIVNEKCNGNNHGAIVISVTGGVAPIVYSWNNGSTGDTLTGLTAGTYCVTATDSVGCSASACYTITEPTAITDTAVLTLVSCSGPGSIVVTATGGTGSLTYSWSTGGSGDSIGGLGIGTYTVTITDSVGCSVTALYNLGSNLSSLTFGQPVLTNPTCNLGATGSIITSIIGGTPPVVYVWSTGANGDTLSGLRAGTYCVTATDSTGCSASACYTLTDPSAITETSVITNVTCSSLGSIVVTATGGTGALTYGWSTGGNTDSITGLAAGTYTLTITDSVGCSITASFTVVNNCVCLLTFDSAIIRNEKCYGDSFGAIVVSINGGTAPIVYSWSNGATGDTLLRLGAGTYCVTATDSAGCSATACYTVTQPTQITETAIVNNVTCATPGSIYVTATGGTGNLIYRWSNGGITDSLTGLGIGTYTLTITDSAGCSVTALYNVGSGVSNLTLVPNITNSACGNVNNGSITVTVTGDTSAISYIWNTGAIGGTITGLGAGTYCVTASDANGCSASACYTINQSSAVVIDTGIVTGVTCSGPNSGSITVTSSGGAGNITYTWSNGGTGATISNLGVGTYCVTATDTSGCTATRCFIISQANPLVIDSATVNPVVCGDSTGTITVTVTGGTPVYTFNWSNGASGNPFTSGPGSYSVTVTDANGCSATAYYIIGRSSCGGCPAVNTNNNVSIPCTENCATLVASAFSAAQTTTYTMDSIPFVPPFDFCTGTAILVHTDDLWSSVINLPFDFCFFGNTYNKIIVGSNGVVSFNTANANAFNSWAIPGPFPQAAPADLRNCIMGPWQDLDPTNSGNLYYNVTGTAPCRKFEVAWCNVPMYGDAGSVNTSYCSLLDHQYQMIVIYETTNAIDVYIKEKDVPCEDLGLGYWNGGLAAEGIQNAAGATAFMVPGRNSTIWSATNDAWRWTPAGAPNYVINWFVHGTDSLGTGDTLVVCPDTATTYQVTATYTNCDGNVIVVADSVYVTPGGGLTVSIDSVIQPSGCGGTGGAVYASFNATSPVTDFGWIPGGDNLTSLTNLGPGTYIFHVTTLSGCDKSDTVILTAPQQLTVTVPNDTISGCAGTLTDSLTALVSGGTPGYTYAWSTVPVQINQTATGLAIGTYTVTVTDASGCTATGSGSIILTGGIAVTIDSALVTNVSCPGGSNGGVTIFVSGGTGAITYNWSTGATTQDITGLSPGTYCVTASDSIGCSASACYTITQPAAFIVDTVITSPASCDSGGTIMVIITGGTGTLTYTWSTGQTGDSIGGVAGGPIGLTVTDANGCTFSATFTVPTAPGALTFGPPVFTPPSCNGDSNGCIIASATGGQGTITFVWSNGDSLATNCGLASGAYSVTITDSVGCSASTTYILNEPTPVALAAPVIDSILCFGDSGCITAVGSGGTPPYIFTWSTGDTTAQVCNLRAGTYCVTATDSSGCSASACYTLTQPTPLSIDSSVVTPIGCTTGGSIVVYVSGGVGPYTYTWSIASNVNLDSIGGLTQSGYTVTITDANGCNITASFTVPSVPGAVTFDSAAIVNVSCNGGSNGSIIAYATDSAGGPIVYTWSNGFIGDTVTGLSVGQYCVTATDSIGCSASACYTITQPNAITFGNPSVTNTTCAGDSNGCASIIASGGTGTITYLWNGGATTDTVCGLAAGTYTVTATDSLGCTATASVTINQPAPDSITAVVTNISCNGSNDGSIVATGIGGNGGFTYSWSTGATTNTISGLSAGQYCVTATDSLGCSASACYTITNPAAIVIDSALVINGTCTTGGSIAIIASGGTGVLNYNWSGTIQTGPFITNLSAGTYGLTISDGNNCSITASYTITTSSSSLTLNGPTQVNPTCFGAATGSLCVNAVDNVGIVSYVWSTGANTNCVTGLTAGGSPYCVTVTDSLGCTATACYTLTQPTAISQTGSIVNQGCSTFGSITLTATGGTPGTTGYTFQWSVGGSHGDSIAGLSAGTYTVTITDSLGCTGSATYTVTNGGGSLTLGAPTIINIGCTAGGTGSITVNPSGGGGGDTYSWSNGGTTQTITGLAAGQYCVTVTDANSCTASACYSITQGNVMSVSITGTPFLCFSIFDGSLCATVTGGTAPFRYAWSDLNDSSCQSALAAGSYTVTVTDTTGCTATATWTIVGDREITYTNQGNPVCSNALGFDSITGLSNSGTPPFIYIFSGPFTDTSYTGGFNNIPPLTPYYITVVDSYGCSVTVYDSIAEIAHDEFTYIGDSTSCFGLKDGEIIIHNENPSAPPYVYTVVGDTTQSDTIFTGLGAGSYVVQIADGKGCVYDDTVAIGQPVAPSLMFIPDTIGPNGPNVVPSTVNSDTITLNPIYAGFTNPVYQWSPSTGLSCVDCPNPQVTIAPPSPIVYTLTISDSLNSRCFITDSVYIIIYGQGWMPNAFTPNGDGVDDLFGPVHWSFANVVTFHIYNRWGQMVHNSTDYWDGKFDGKEQPAGAYVYYIEFTYPDNLQDGQLKTVKQEGSVMLLR